MINIFCYLLLMSSFHIPAPEASHIAHHVRSRAGIVPAPLAFSVMAVESGFRKGAVSPMGAKGLMQITDIAVEDVRNRWGALMTKVIYGESLTEEEDTYMRNCKLPHDLNLIYAEQNIQVGMCYLHLLSTRYSTIVEVLAAYNGGHRQVMRLNKGLPLAQETANYIPKVLFTQQLYTRRTCQ